MRALDSADALQARPAADGDRVATPLLQLVMEAVWEQERAQGSQELSLSTLQNLRGVRSIVDAHLDKALASLGSGERQAAIDMFDHLVTPSGGKIAESVPDLARRTGHSEAQVGTVLEKLDHERIVRPVPAAPGQDPARFRRYEIFHDVLAPTINRAIAASEERRRARRLRRLAALAVGLLIVALGIAAGFATLTRTADSEKSAAESRALAAEAIVNLTHDPELSALLALQSLQVQYNQQAENLLRTALPELQAIRIFRDQTTVYSAAFDPADANKVASGDQSGVASVWDVKTGSRLLRMSLPGGFAASGTADTVAFDPAGTEVAVGFGGGAVALFDAHSGHELGSARVPGSPAINRIAFLGSTGKLAIATRKGLFLWLSPNGSRCCDMLAGTPTNSVSVDPHDPMEVAAATTSGVVLWNVSGHPRSRLLSPFSVNDAAFSPDGREVATAVGDGYVFLYNVATRQAVSFLGAGEASAWRVTFSPDGRQIVAGYAGGTTRVWDTAAGVQVSVLAGSASGIEATGFSADGTEVVTASDDGTIRVWHSEPRELRAEFTDAYAGGSAGPLDGASYLGDGRIAALGGTGDVVVFNPGGGQRAKINPGTAVTSMAWDRAGTEIVTAGFTGTVDLWRAVGSGYSQVPLSSPIRVNAVLAVGMSWDGSRVAIETSDYTIQVRSTHTGQLLQQIRTVKPIRDIAFSPDGQQILAADYSGQVQVWYAGSGNRTRILGSPGPALTYISYDDSGSEFVTAARSGSITVWSAPGDRARRTIDACASPEMAALSPDGSKIVVACGDGSVPVYDAGSGQLLTKLPAAIQGGVSFAAFSPDGKSIVTTVDTGTTGCVQIWDARLAVSSLKAVEQMAGHRITRRLTPAEQQQYLSGITG